jgi:hypothetical protein
MPSLVIILNITFPAFMALNHGRNGIDDKGKLAIWGPQDDNANLGIAI